MFKKFAVTMATAAMVAASAMTAMAATTNYFYVYENGIFRAARMGQDCVAGVSKNGNTVTMSLKDGEYGNFTGSITEAWVDTNGNGELDGKEKSLMNVDGTAIVYDQSENTAEINGTIYTNFTIEVSITGAMEMTKVQHTYVPMQ